MNTRPSRLLLCLSLHLLAASASAGLVGVQMDRADGFAISGVVDTAADTFRIDSWITPVGGNFRTPVSTELPFTLSAFTLAGDAFDVPDLWTGDIGLSAGWAFLLPVGQGVGAIQWVEGQPSSAFTNASFGWGGFRNTAGQNFLRGGPTTMAYLPSLNGASDARFTTVTLRPIPEPSGALFGVALSLLGLGRARRRRSVAKRCAKR